MDGHTVRYDLQHVTQVAKSCVVHVYVGVRGCTWVYVGVCGCTWVYVGVCGCTWVYVGAFAFVQCVCI